VSLSAERSQGQTALAWLRDALWAPDADVAYEPVDAGGDWLARPASGSPELLVPLGSRRAAAAVSRRFWDGMPLSRRARQWVGEAVLRSGLAEWRWPGRVALVGEPDPGHSLLTALAAHLDAGPLLAAITLRPQAFNGKPILQLFDERGTPVAFAKVAVDDLTAEYVATEAEWLRRAERLAGPVRAPRLLDLLDWQGRPVALLEPLDLPRLPRRRAPLPVEAIADLGERRTATVAEVAAGPVDLIDLLLDRHGDAPVEVGGWHGDLSPWNTATRGGRLLVWDWELAGDDLPVGTDRVHHEVMVATHLRGVSADDALAALEPGVERDLYLLELVRRDRRADRLGRPDPERRLGDAADRCLRGER
jgi:hypothetical protein